MSESILDIPEHERRLRHHPDTLLGKEEAVIEAAIQWRHQARSQTAADDQLWEAVDALIVAREKQ